MGAAQVSTRRACDQDAEAIAELSGQLGYPSATAQVQERMGAVLQSDNDAVFVACQDNRVIGWIHASLVHLLELDARVEINALVVAERMRSSGTGAALLMAAENWARGKRCARLSVRSNVLREKAHQFYLRNGYEHYKTQKAFRKDLT